MFKKNDKVEHAKFGSGKVLEEMGKGAHGDRALVKFDKIKEKGEEKVILTSHLENHSDNERVRREREKDEINKIKKRKMVIDSSQLDGVEEEEAEEESAEDKSGATDVKKVEKEGKKKKKKKAKKKKK